MLWFLFLVKFIAFPQRKDSILDTLIKDSKQINVEASGSLGLFYHSKCQQTYPNETLYSNEVQDWCSNIAPSKEEKDNPWVQYSVPNKAFKLTGYSLRNGCCRRYCCCVDDNTDLGYCCCDLYSFSLHGSNDNVTWKLIHQVQKENHFYYCLFKTYELETQTEPFRYLRLVQDEEYPGCPKCMQINQIEFYGTLIDDYYIHSFSEEDEGDESVSIIGKVKRNQNE